MTTIALVFIIIASVAIFVLVLIGVRWKVKKLKKLRKKKLSDLSAKKEK